MIPSGKVKFPGMIEIKRADNESPYLPLWQRGVSHDEAQQWRQQKMGNHGQSLLYHLHTMKVEMITFNM